MTAIHYTLSPIDPHRHEFQVILEVAEPTPGELRLSLPAWIPGSYMIRDFARNVTAIAASDSNGTLLLEKQDKQTWRCTGPFSGVVTVVYRVYAWDLSVRGAHLDSTHGYCNGTSVFLRVEGRDEAPIEVTIEPPPVEVAAGWQVATTLERRDAPPCGFGTYRASDYDELIDHPVEMGSFTRLEFEVGGVPHAMAITGRHRTDLARLADDLARICRAHQELFADDPPMERYLFQVMAVGDGYGGLEHRASTSLMCSRYDLPQPGMGKISDEYRGFLGLCSHEYFHTWNIKRIKPAAFVPYRLQSEVHTPLLWAFEGITSYYDDLALVRSGVIPVDSYLELLAQTITRVARGAGRFKQSVSESSFDAWTRFYKQDENAPNAIVSYYAKGSLVALCLDLHMRKETDGDCSLDSVMQALWRDYGRTGVGVEPDGLETLFEAVSGLELKPLFDRWVRGTEDLPVAELLQGVGVQTHWRAASGPDDKGGKPGDAIPGPVLGVRSGANPLGAQLLNVFDGAAAGAAGLAAGDIVVAVDGLRVEHASLHRRVAAYPPGEPLVVHAFRRDELMRFEVRPLPAPQDTCWLTLSEQGSDGVGARLDGWLQSGSGA